MTFEQAAIEAFRSAPIAESDLDPNGISFLSVKVAGVRVRASWYSGLAGFGAHARDLMVDGRMYPEGGHAIIKAAMQRSKGLLREDMAKLDALVNK